LNYNETLFSESQQSKDVIYIIHKGSVSLSKTFRGQKIILETLMSGCVLGFLSIFDNRRILYDAVVDSRKAQIFEIRKDDLVKILESEGHSKLIEQIK